MPPYDSINLHPSSHQPSSLKDTTFDVICIGSGWAGRVVAARVIKAGFTAVIVENELIGGDCPSWACVPSKVLLRAQEALLEALGVSSLKNQVASDSSLDAQSVFATRDMFAAGWDDRLRLVPLVESSGTKIVRGTGKLVGEKQVLVEAASGETVTLKANHAVVIGTGSYATIPDIPGLAEANPWTPRHATSASSVPKRLIVLGGGAVGCEMAAAYASFGSKVSIIAATSEILPRMEPEAGRLVREVLAAQDATFYLSSKPTKVSRDRQGVVTVELSDGRKVEGEEILVSAGRTPQTSNVGLDKFGIPTDGTPIAVDDALRVKEVPGIWLYAAGDVNGRHPLTHGSKYHGRTIASDIIAKAKDKNYAGGKWARSSATADNVAVPQVVFTNPVVATVGLTKNAAECAGRSVREVTALVRTLGAQIRDQTQDDGWAQWVIENGSEKIIGATFVGKGVTDLLHASTVAIVGEMTLERMAHAVPPFPTMSEVYLNLLEAAGY